MKTITDHHAEALARILEADQGVRYAGVMLGDDQDPTTIAVELAGGARYELAVTVPVEMGEDQGVAEAAAGRPRCAYPGDSEHDHEMCRDALAELAEAAEDQGVTELAAWARRAAGTTR